MINVKLLDMDVGVPCYSHLHKNGVETAAVIGIAATVIGGAVTYASARDTNEHNDYWNQQNLNWQKQAFQQEMDYNSPVNQRAMLEDAGYSPYAYLGGAGSSVGTSSGISPTPMQNPMANVGFDKLAQQLYGFADMAADVNNKKADTSVKLADAQNRIIQNKYADRIMQADLESRLNSAKLTGNEAKIAKLTYDLKQQTFDSDAQNAALRNDLLKHQIDNAVADTTLKNWNALISQREYMWIDKLRSTELKQRLAQISTLYAQRDLNYATAKKMVAETMESVARTNKVKVETNVIERTADAYVAGVAADTGIKYLQTISKDLDNQMKQLDIDYYEGDKKFERAGQIIGGIVGGTTAYKNVKGAKPGPKNNYYNIHGNTTYR